MTGLAAGNGNEKCACPSQEGTSDTLRLHNIQPGKYLCEQIERVMSITQKFNLNLGEVYILGDSPLVLLTALQSSFEADPSSSDYVIKMSPRISEHGTYEFNNKGRNIRVYTHLDINLMFEDFFAKLELMNK